MPAPVAPPGRPSRPRADWSAERDRVASPGDLDAIDWSSPLPHARAVLDRGLVARWLAAGDSVPVQPLTATSRAPGSRLNRSAPKLSTDLTATLRIGADTDDRGRTVVATSVRADNRRGRRALDAATLDGGWVRRRGTASTLLRRTSVPDADRRATALRTADAVADLLERLAWPLPSWVLTATG